VVAFTGAGISAESGIPTFRGAGGLWRNFRAEDLATPGAFERNPKLVWEWYEWRRSVIAQAEPNAGHLALAQLARRFAGPGQGDSRGNVPESGKDFRILTQNVDGLHDRAAGPGPPSAILKLHGDIWMQRCVSCGREHRRAERPFEPQPELPPRCGCGGLERPGVVWFNEPMPEGWMSEAYAMAQAADLMLVIGTSAVVYPAAGLIDAAREAGARVVEVNIAETPASARVHLSWRASAAEALPALLA
jgi:NAD-dependent deacetylase